MEPHNQLKLSIIILILLVGTGTVGYSIIEGWGFFDSLYMTVITLTTIGYKEVHTMSDGGRVFTIFVVIFGVGTAAYAFKSATSLMLEGELREVLGRRRLQKRISQLKDHYIVCGYGRMGRIVCRELRLYGMPFVIIERDTHLTALESHEDFLIFNGDATKDDDLVSVGIERAAGLVAVLPSDAENLYVVLSARGLNPNLKIISRSLEDGSEQKLIRAGADRVISPYHIGALRIAYTILRPTVVDFIEFATASDNLDLQLEEIIVKQGSRLIGLTLEQCKIGRDIGVIIVAIKRASGKMLFNPFYQSMIEEGDTLIALGPRANLKNLEAMIKS
jgi:voltage-gated potassium channel